MKLFSKNKKLIVYVILFLVVLLFLYLCFQKTIEGFCKINQTPESKQEVNQQIEGDVCFDHTKVLSNKSTDKFQYISCIFEKKHPKIDDINVNFVIQNNDGTFFDITGETILTYNQSENIQYDNIENIENKISEIVNNNEKSNNNTDNSNTETDLDEEIVLIDDTPNQPINTLNMVIKSVKPSHTIKLKIKSDFNNINVEELEAGQKQKILPSGIPAFMAINSTEENGLGGFGLTINNMNQLVYHESSSNKEGNIIDYELPNDKFSDIELKISNNVLNVTIENDGQPFTQEINLANSITEDSYSFILFNDILNPMTNTSIIDIKNFSLKNTASEQNNNTETNVENNTQTTTETNTQTNQVTYTTSDEKPNDFMYLDLGECKYHLSALDHILIKHNNISIYENELLGLKDWENEKSKGYICGGLRNIIYKNCNKEIIQNYNVSSKIPLILSPYKKEDETLELPDLYVIYNSNKYTTEQEMVDYIRGYYPDKVIQIIGSFNYGKHSQDVKSYEQMINNSEYNENNKNNKNNNEPECALTNHGCCSDGKTSMDDTYGTNCPPLPCSFSQFGCCKDGITTLNDQDGSNCPVFN